MKRSLELCEPRCIRCDLQLEPHTEISLGPRLKLIHVVDWVSGTHLDRPRKLLCLSEGQGHATSEGRVRVKRRITDEDQPSYQGSARLADQTLPPVLDASHCVDVGDRVASIKPRGGDIECVEHPVKHGRLTQATATRVVGGDGKREREGAIVSWEGKRRDEIEA